MAVRAYGGAGRPSIVLEYRVMAAIRIGLSGKMLSGKSLVAQYLVDCHGFTMLSFAARLKELAAELFSPRQEKDRFLLQQLGEHLRTFDATVWLRYLVERIPHDRDVVVADVRYPNEYSTLKRLGFVMVRMVTDRAWQTKAMKEFYPDMPPVLLDDITETLLDDHKFDHYIDNREVTPLEQVYAQVETLMTCLKGDARERQAA